VPSLTTSRGDLAYSDGGEGETVLLLHGWPVGPSVFRRLAPLLRTRFRVLVPELTGGGDIAEQAAAVSELLEALSIERVAVVGHSHGGGVAQLLAMQGRADALVLIDSVAFDSMPPTDLEVRTFVERGSSEFASLPDDDLAAYLESPARPAPSLDDRLLGVAEALSDRDLPVFMLWGEDDPFVGVEVAERLSEAIPGSALGVVPESGHFLLDDAFDSVGVLIAEYLRARYLGAPHGHEGIVTLQLERRPPWVDLAPYERDDEDEVPRVPDPSEQEVGPHA
jgi:pimeloyl-ACP methyl ester carboxylesterase